jgi:hypothetical protein
MLVDQDWAREIVTPIAGRALMLAVGSFSTTSSIAADGTFGRCHAHPG